MRRALSWSVVFAALVCRALSIQQAPADEPVKTAAKTSGTATVDGAKDAPKAPVSPFEKWEGEIRKFEAQDEQSPPPACGIVFVGSSSIRLWKLNESFPDLPVINRGFGGSQIVDSAHFAERIVVKYRPRMVVFYAGDNDIAQKKTAETLLADFQKFVEVVRRSLPCTKIVFIAVKPSPSRWKFAEEQRKTNAAIREFCDQSPCLEFVDVWPEMLGEDGQPRAEFFVADRLHMSAEGYRLWTSLVRPHLD